MQLNINGEIFEVADGDGLRPLLWVLRDELGLTGTKYGAVRVSAAPARCIWMAWQRAAA